MSDEIEDYKKIKKKEKEEKKEKENFISIIIAGTILYLIIGVALFILGNTKQKLLLMIPGGFLSFLAVLQLVIVLIKKDNLPNTFKNILLAINIIPYIILSAAS